jgi:UPF0716 protein FxsA
VAILLLIAFIGTPIVEIAVFMQVGEQIGFWPTLAIVVATAIAGTWLLRYQGLATLARARESLARQEFPLEEVFDGLCLLFAGALLLTPGFVTDAIGLALFMPPIRRLLQHFMRRWLANSPNAAFFVNGENISRRGATPTPPRDHGGPTIDGEWEEIRQSGDKSDDGSDNDKPNPPRIEP